MQPEPCQATPCDLPGRGLSVALCVQEFSIYDRKDIAAGLQSFLICIEMFPAAITHAYAFPPRDYLDPAQQGKRGLMYSLRAMFDVRDVMEDINLITDDTVSHLCWSGPCCSEARQVGPWFGGCRAVLQLSCCTCSRGQGTTGEHLGVAGPAGVQTTWSHAQGTKLDHLQTLAPCCSPLPHLPACRAHGRCH